MIQYVEERVILPLRNITPIEVVAKKNTAEWKRQVQRSRIQNVIRSLFQDSNNYMKSGTLMVGVIEKLDDAIDFHDIDLEDNSVWCTSRF